MSKWLIVTDSYKKTLYVDVNNSGGMNVGLEKYCIY